LLISAAWSDDFTNASLLPPIALRRTRISIALFATLQLDNIGINDVAMA
jgi:hypothetical protein